MPNSQRFFVGLCLVIGACSVLLFCGFSETDCLLMLSESSNEISSSATKSAMFEPRHHGHRLFKPRHHGHKISAIRNEHMYDKVMVSQRRNHRSTEKDQKEPMAKDRPQSDSSSVTKNGTTSTNSSNMIYSPPIWDIHGASQQPYHKHKKHGVLEKEEGRHRAKRENDEDLYYTFDAEYEVRTRLAESKIIHFLRESIGWLIESKTENDEANESFLRGGSIDSYEE